MDYMLLIDKCVKWLIILACIGLFLLIISQALLQIEGIRTLIVPVEKWEGERIPFA